MGLGVETAIKPADKRQKGGRKIGKTGSRYLIDKAQERLSVLSIYSSCEKGPNGDASLGWV